MRRVRCLCVCMCPLVQHEVAACSWLYIVEILFGQRFGRRGFGFPFELFQRLERGAVGGRWRRMWPQ